MKDNGKLAISKGDPIDAYNRLEKSLASKGIHIVPVGELEGFIKGVNSLHGPNWVNSVLEFYPNLNNDVYDDVKQFIRSLEL